MYINPLNNGKISDYNSLKNQINPIPILNKYRKKLETIPNETQKYYQYLTYQQSILDELNYVAERLKTEDIKKQKDNYEFLEDLKIKREGQLKKFSNKEDIAYDLFDNISLKKNNDMTPTINTDLEMVYPVNEVIENLEGTAAQKLQSAFRNKKARDTVINRGAEVAISAKKEALVKLQSAFRNKKARIVVAEEKLIRDIEKEGILSVADTMLPIKEKKEKKEKTPEELAKIEEKKLIAKIKRDAKKLEKKRTLDLTK
jgi:hypothetical protein